MQRIPAIAAISAVALLLAVVYAMVSQERSPRVDDILTEGTKLCSQFDEELIIRHFFHDRRGGYFVDVGASEWQRNSTTYYLEKHLGWSGIALDALPWLADGYAKYRPRTKFLNYIVTDHSGTEETFYAAGEVSSTKKEHMEQFAGGESFRPQEIKVPTITLNELLDQLGIAKIDFLSMDIEQGEPAALAGFDIERFRPDLVCIEAAVSVRPHLIEYFADHGYERIEEYLEYDKVNWYYKPKTAPAP